MTPGSAMNERSIPPGLAAAARSMMLDHVAAESTAALRGQGIEAIVLKGPSIARWIYDHEGERPYVDIDLLVHPRTARSAGSILIGLGFERYGLDTIREDWPRHASVFRRGKGISIDLHHTLVGVGVPAEQVWEVLSARTETMLLGGCEVTVLAPDARAAVLALHAAKDGRRVAKVRRDLQRAVERLPCDVWEGAARVAGDLRAAGSFAEGLRRVPAGADLVSSLGISGAPPVEIALRSEAVPPLAAGLEWMLSAAGVRRLKLVIRKLFPPRAYLRAWSPLARKGWFGLAAARLYRPLWVIAKVGPAYVAVRKARRRAVHGGNQ